MIGYSQFSPWILELFVRSSFCGYSWIVQTTSLFKKRRVFFFSRFLRQTHFAARFQQFVPVNHPGIQHLFHYNQQDKLPIKRSECHWLCDQHPGSPLQYQYALKSKGHENKETHQQLRECFDECFLRASIQITLPGVQLVGVQREKHFSPIFFARRFANIR